MHKHGGGHGWWSRSSFVPFVVLLDLGGMIVYVWMSVCLRVSVICLVVWVELGGMTGCGWMSECVVECVCAVQ